jgi:isochorismate pyruvate lyase
MNCKRSASEYGANPDMIEAIYREMISRFVNMEMSEFHKKQDNKLPFAMN